MINNLFRLVGFWVLWVYDVFLVFVEFGYLLNKYDEKLFVFEEWCECMVMVMVEVVDGFFRL